MVIKSEIYIYKKIQKYFWTSEKFKLLQIVKIWIEPAPSWYLKYNDLNYNKSMSLRNILYMVNNIKK